MWSNRMDTTISRDRDLLSIQPREVKLPFELQKQISCSLHLVNITDKVVAFKVKTTAPRNYFVRPNSGLLSPKSSYDVIITMQAQREAPPDMQCKDRFLVESVIAPFGTNAKELPLELFSKEAGKDVHEARLRVLFVAPPPPSALAEQTEDFLTPRMVSGVDSRGRHYANPDGMSKEVIELKAKLTEARAEHAKMKVERSSAVERSQRLQQELSNTVAEMERRKAGSSKGNSQALRPKHPRKFSILSVFVVGVLGVFIGYFFINRRDLQ